MSTTLPKSRRLPASNHGSPRGSSPSLPRVDLFGVKVTKADEDEILETIVRWGVARRPATVDFFGVHGLTEARRNPAFLAALNRLDVVTCDGQPIRWALNRWYDAGIARRVYGPTMTLRVCEAAARLGLSVYFYGSRPEVLERLCENLRERFPRLSIAGAESPPFRPLTAAEQNATADRINASGAAFVFIGLGCPKQELFAADMADRIDAVQLCVGAAFEFHAGTARMAPLWMQDAGLEWFYRLCREPRRLWRRYLFGNASFIGLWLRRELLRSSAGASAFVAAGSEQDGLALPTASAALTVAACERSAADAGPAHAATAQRQVSVVVPLYNERDCIETLLTSLTRLEQSLAERFGFEFLLIDDGSTDGTPALVKTAIDGKQRFRLIQHDANRGIAAAIQTGLRSAQYELVASIDCDGSYDVMLLAELIPLLDEGVDLVTASPYHPQGAVENIPAWRLRLSRSASRCYGLVCRKKLSCYTSCFRVYRRSTVAPIELDNERFVGVAELLCKVLERGGSVVEHPASLRPRAAGRSKMRVVRATAGHLRLIVKLGRRRLWPGRRIPPLATAATHDGAAARRTSPGA